MPLRSLLLTFDFGIGCFFSISNIDHHEALRRLIETNDKLFEVVLSDRKVRTAERVQESPFVEENVYPQLVLIGAIGSG